MSNMFSPAKAFFLILAVSLVPQFSLQVLAQDIDPPPAPEAPKPVQKEEEVIGTSPALERYQECFQQMIDAGISDNQYMRECLDIDDVKKPTPGSTAKLSEQEATSVVMGGVKPLEVCYQGLLDRSKSLSLVPEGMINPHLTLGPKGEVTEVKFETGQIVDLTLLECFKSNLKILNFKKATPGTSLRLQYRLSAVGSKKSARVALAKGFPKMVGPSYSLSDQDILAVFRRHAPKVRACFEDLLKTAPKATGQIAVDLVVKANGRVKKVVYKENTLTDKKFKSCVSTQLKNFVFPKSGSSADTIVKYPPFVFSPGQINQ